MVRINVLFHLFINGVYWGCNPLILTLWNHSWKKKIYPIASVYGIFTYIYHTWIQWVQYTNWRRTEIPPVNPTHLLRSKISLVPHGHWEQNAPLKFKIQWPRKKCRWKMTFLFEMLTFQGRTVELRGCLGCFSSPKSKWKQLETFHSLDDADYLLTATVVQCVHFVSCAPLVGSITKKRWLQTIIFLCFQKGLQKCWTRVPPKKGHMYCKL